jgi:xanthine dehydrogenase accessory factor
MSGWIAAARRALDHGPAALVTILGVEGSAPRGAGTRMVVTERGLEGSIGGGALEHVAIRQARAVLGHAPGTWRVQDYPLGPLLGQCCGGRVRLLVERLDPARAAWLDHARAGDTLITRFADHHLEREVAAAAPLTPPTAKGPAPGPGDAIVEPVGDPQRPLLMFGAGHVGRAIAAAGSGLPFALQWWDTRPEAADGSRCVLADEPALLAAAEAAGPDAAILILTHDHALDFRLTAAALRGRAGFVGLIGSATKRARFLSRLAKAELGEAARARLTCPIGLPGIAGKEPEVIAIAVLAQLLTLRAPAPCA